MSIPAAANATVQLAGGIGSASRRLRASGRKPCAVQPTNATTVTAVGISTGISMVRASMMVMAIRPEMAMTTTVNAGQLRANPCRCHHGLAASWNSPFTPRSSGA